MSKEKARLNAIDWFLLIAVVLCAVLGVLRFVLNRNGDNISGAVTMEDYIVSFKISNIRNSSLRYLKDGTQYYLAANEKPFGTVEGNVSVTPALYRIENAHGEYVQAFAPENGDATRVDVVGAFRVKGYMSENGFLADGTTSVAVNRAVTLRSPFLYVTVNVTGITKAE